jgi:hypothetical protein
MTNKTTTFQPLASPPLSDPRAPKNLREQPTPQLSPQLTSLNQAEPLKPLAARSREAWPRERLIEFGAEHLSPDELLAVLLNTGRGRHSDVLELARSLLREFGSLLRLREASFEVLCQVKGIGPVKATRLLAAFELSRRAQLPLSQVSQEELGSTERGSTERGSTERGSTERGSCAPPPLDPLTRFAQQASSLCLSSRDAYSAPHEPLLLAYPLSSGLSEPERVITLAIGEELSSVGERLDEREVEALLLSWLRRLLVEGEEAQPKLSSALSLNHQAQGGRGEELERGWGLISRVSAVASSDPCEREALQQQLASSATRALERLSERAGLLGLPVKGALLLFGDAYLNLAPQRDEPKEPHQTTVRPLGERARAREQGGER